ncbi:M56 family metallopeptidase [Streptomyces sp. NPDC049954]|uniref:M56 family metallopeptidase n=1 Tax=Streptomyces sp. NPDC049954 TaxID=3155779 RepID=UPI00344731A1
MGYVVFLPFVVPLTALPVARLVEQRLHPRTVTLLLTAVSCVLALCSTLCLGLLGVVGTARLPGNPLPDGWADPEVRAVVPYDEVTGFAAIAAILAAGVACAVTAVRYRRVRAGARRALAGVRPEGDLVLLPDAEPYAYALPGRPGRVVVSHGMYAGLDAGERRALLAHERAHLAGRHHGLLLLARLAACANPLLRPLVPALAYGAERWADEEAARVVGDRRLTAVAVGKAALSLRPSGPGLLPAFAAGSAGPVPRRVAALLGPAPSTGWLPSAWTPVGWAVLMAGGGVVVSTAASFSATVTMVGVLSATAFQ